jgi:acyl-coenzyme A thioesterase PaaI-like protein
MAESFRTRLLRWKFRVFPCYRGTGAKVTYIASDFREIRMELPLSWRTYNYVGTIFGGSMFAAADPIYMIMLIRILGEGYTVWDKAGAIRFLRPGRSTLFGTFVVDETTTGEIVESLRARRSIDRVFTVTLVDAEGVPHAEVEKTIFIRNDRWKGPKAGSSVEDGRA